MKYKIITGSKLETLEQNVKSYLDKGWNLHGSPFIDTPNLYPRYAQAVVYDDYDIEDDLSWMYDQTTGPNQ